MEDSIIARIQSEISAKKTTLQQLNVERNDVLRVLYRARFVDVCNIHRIKAQYAAKIDNTTHEIEGMKRHLRELMGDGT